MMNYSYSFEIKPTQVAQTSPVNRFNLRYLRHSRRKLIVQDAKVAEPIGKKIIDKRIMDHVIKSNANLWFKSLAFSWKQETAGLSSIDKKVSHPDYKKIIKMGEYAITPILKEMSVEPGHWFAALKAITGEQPVPAEMRGRVDLMSAVWLKWGKENGYI